MAAAVSSSAVALLQLLALEPVEVAAAEVSSKEVVASLPVAELSEAVAVAVAVSVAEVAAVCKSKFQ